MIAVCDSKMCLVLVEMTPVSLMLDACPSISPRLNEPGALSELNYLNNKE